MYMISPHGFSNEHVREGARTVCIYCLHIVLFVFFPLSNKTVFVFLTIAGAAPVKNSQREDGAAQSSPE